MSVIDEVIDNLELKMSLDRDISELSGGELQRVAIAATILKDADIYFFDEPSSYLDIYQRLNIAKVIPISFTLFLSILRQIKQTIENRKTM